MMASAIIPIARDPRITIAAVAINTETQIGDKARTATRGQPDAWISIYSPPLSILRNSAVSPESVTLRGLGLGSGCIVTRPLLSMLA